MFSRHALVTTINKPFLKSPVVSGLTGPESRMFTNKGKMVIPHTAFPVIGMKQFRGDPYMMCYPFYYGRRNIGLFTGRIAKKLECLEQNEKTKPVATFLEPVKKIIVF